MGVLDKNLTLPPTLSDLVEAKDQAIAKMVTARKLLKESEGLLNQFGNYLFPHDANMNGSHERCLTDLNQRLWQKAFDMTGFRQLMDRKAVQEFQSSLQQNPPDFNEENIRTTFLSLHQDSHALFRRGIVNVFQGLSREYRTNTKEPFRVGPKVICNYMLTAWHGPLRVNYSNYASNELDDVDRVFKTLDGQKFTPRALEAAINASFADGSNEHNDEYFRMKGFRKGSLHIWFKRADLLEQVNDLIAEEFSEGALADGRRAA